MTLSLIKWPSNGGGGGGVSGANNGLSLLGGNVVLGNDLSFAPGGSAQLTNDRSIDMNGFQLLLVDGTASPNVTIARILPSQIGLNDNTTSDLQSLLSAGGLTLENVGVNLMSIQSSLLTFTDSATGFIGNYGPNELTINDAGGSGRFATLNEQVLLMADSALGFLSTQVRQGQISVFDNTTPPGIISDIQAGQILSGGVFKSQQPSVNGAGQWKLGKSIIGPVTLNTGLSIEVMIDGVLRKFLIAA